MKIVNVSCIQIIVCLGILCRLDINCEAFTNDPVRSSVSRRPLSLIRDSRRSLSPAVSLHLASSDGTDSYSGIYGALSASPTAQINESKPGSNFFYNDEVISHLHGYMYLVGLFFAQDVIFLGSFCVLAAIASLATTQSKLPANPRVPAIVALATLGITILLRSVLGYDGQMELLSDSLRYEGPTESALQLECLICALNIAWGFFGTWKTKEPQSDGATRGF